MGLMSVPDLLLATEWLHIILDCPHLRVCLGGRGGEGAALSLTGLCFTTSKTLVEDDKLSAVYGLRLEGMALQLQGSGQQAQEAGQAPLSLGPSNVDLSVSVTYEDVVVTSRQLLPQVTMAYDVGCSAVCQSARLTWAEGHVDVLGQLLREVEGTVRLCRSSTTDLPPSTSIPSLSMLGGGSFSEVPTLGKARSLSSSNVVALAAAKRANVRWNVRLGLPRLEGAYSWSDVIEGGDDVAFDYKLHGAVTGVLVIIQPQEVRCLHAGCEAIDAHLDLARRSQPPPQRCCTTHFLHASKLSVTISGSGARPTAAVASPPSDPPRFVTLAVESLGLEWSPALVTGMSMLAAGLIQQLATLSAASSNDDGLAPVLLPVDFGEEDSGDAEAHAAMGGEPNDKPTGAS